MVAKVFKRLAAHIGELKFVASRAGLPREHQRELDVLVALVLRVPVEQANRQRRVLVVFGYHRTDLMTGERHILTGQTVHGPRLGIQGVVGGMVTAVGHVPRAQTLLLGASCRQHLLVHRARFPAYANSEQIGVHCVVLVNTGYELIASEVARE